MRLANRFTDLAGIDHPIVQEGMGPFKTTRLAAAVSDAGGLGTVSMPGMSREPAEAARVLRKHIEETASLTERPFAVNVPVGTDETGKVLPISDAYVRAVIEARENDPVIAERLRVLTTSAGNPEAFRPMIAATNLVHMHKVGSTKHAIRAEELGVDVVIASGYEMGGHTHEAPVHTFVLVPNVTAAVEVPVLLSGGAHDGRTLAAALLLGADGVAMGTRFIASDENVDWHAAYAERVLEAQEGDDVVFPGVYGPARGLRTAGIAELERLLERGDRTPDEITKWKDLALIRAQEEGDVDGGLVAAGQVASAITSKIHVASFVPAMAREAASLLREVSTSVTVE
jgi:NAD(P)H-dependent flavin oxidoreductase YrpB (nitropropane dioxygenase family)